MVEQNPYLLPRSQERPLRFLGGQGGDGALPDKLKGADLHMITT